MSNGSQPTRPPFAPNSRYFGNPTGTYTAPDGTAHVYVLRRFIPSPDQYAVLSTYTVVQGDRYDTIANEYLGDPEQFWRLADANAVMDPADLQTAGRSINITLPAGIPGQPGD
jgi:hypothetical protein